MLFVTALIANWKTSRRNLLLLAVTLFVIGGLMAGLYLEPTFDGIKKIGFRDEVDPLLQARAARWYAIDSAVWAIGAAAGVCLLLALVRPVGAGIRPIPDIRYPISERECLHPFRIEAPLTFDQFFEIRTEMSDSLRDKSRRMPVDELSRFKESVRENAAPYFGADGCHLPAEVVLVSGRR